MNSYLRRFDPAIDCYTTPINICAISEPSCSQMMRRGRWTILNVLAEHYKKHMEAFAQANGATKDTLVSLYGEDTVKEQVLQDKVLRFLASNADNEAENPAKLSEREVAVTETETAAEETSENETTESETTEAETTAETTKAN